MSKKKIASSQGKTRSLPSVGGNHKSRDFSESKASRVPKPAPSEPASAVRKKSSNG